MPHLTAPGTFVALNYESYPTAPSTSNLFADLAAIWAFSGGGAGTVPSPGLPPPLPLPMPCFPGEPCPPGSSGPSPTACAQACLEECAGLRGSGTPYNVCVQGCQSKCPGGAPRFGTLPGQGDAPGGFLDFLLSSDVGKMIAVVIGIILVLIAVALITR